MEIDALKDEHWVRIEPFVPGGRKGRRGPRTNNRRFVDALIWMARSGGRWRDLPERYGRPNTVWKRFDRWCAAGVWEQLAKALGDPELEEVQLDSTTVKAHPVASTGRRTPKEKKTRPMPGDVSGGAAVD